MSREPSDFLLFLKQRSTEKNGKLLFSVEVAPTDLDALIEKAKHNESIIEIDSLDDVDIGVLNQIRGEAKRALGNLKDKRDALQIIKAIVDKELGE